MREKARGMLEKAGKGKTNNKKPSKKPKKKRRVSLSFSSEEISLDTSGDSFDEYNNCDESLRHFSHNTLRRLWGFAGLSIGRVGRDRKGPDKLDLIGFKGPTLDPSVRRGPVDLLQPEPGMSLKRDSFEK
ncbi:hypothetical protein TNCV_2387901 [Trichonephila clavipes]|nr:hypothetical protein TNCV_2387901 [Trichonephila clavipes]